MKHNQNHDHGRSHDNGHSAAPLLVPVRFEFTDSKATTVGVAGTFNDWQPGAKPMHPFGDGHWLKETALLPGNYEYCLVVDGRWIPDPLAKESVPNPFGGRNSVLTV
jgi:1,4-alpha-glucan branching enzyme